MSGHPPKASHAGGTPVYDSAKRPAPFVEEWLELFHFRALVAHWALRNITLRYKRSVLGVSGRRGGPPNSRWNFADVMVSPWQYSK